MHMLTLLAAAGFAVEGADLILGDTDQAVAASTSRAVSVSGSRDYILRGFTVDPRADATGLRTTGVGTGLTINNKPVTWSSVPGTGATQSFPLSIFTPESVGINFAGLNDIRAFLPSAQSVTLSATLDAAGSCPLSVGVDPVSQDVRATSQQDNLSGNLAWDPRWIFGLGSQTIADGASASLSGTAQVDCPDLGFLILEMITAANLAKVKITSIKIANIELIANRDVATAAIPLSKFQAVNGSLAGLFVGHRIEKNATVVVTITNNSGGAITVRGCFLRAPGAKQAAKLAAKQAVTPAEMTGSPVRAGVQTSGGKYGGQYGGGQRKPFKRMG